MGVRFSLGPHSLIVDNNLQLFGHGFDTHQIHYKFGAFEVRMLNAGIGKSSQTYFILWV
jgi:hypothetical protein